MGHEETYQGSTTYIMHVAGELRYLNMRQKARRVKLMLDWVVHGDGCNSWEWTVVVFAQYAWKETP